MNVKKMQTALPPVFPAQMVDAQVGGEAVEPGGKAALPLKGVQALPGLEEGLLGLVGRLLPIPNQPQGQGIDLILIVQHQPLKGVLIPGLGPGDQLLVGHAAHPPFSDRR